MTRTLVITFTAALLAASCSDSTTPAGTSACCDDGTSKTLRSTCLAGEVTLPATRCVAATDAGTSTCGDGTFDPSSEECDATSPSGNTCSGSRICSSSCVCTAQCGDGTVSEGEGCERNADCDQSTPMTCRACQCELTRLPVEFRDTEVDIAPGLDSELRWLDMRRLTVTLGDRTDFNITLGGSVLNHPSVYRLCMVLSAAEEVGRLCYRAEAGATDFLWETPGEGSRSVGAEIMGGAGGVARVEFLVPEAFNLPFGAEHRMVLFTELNGVLADRLPDSGEIPVADIVGR